MSNLIVTVRFFTHEGKTKFYEIVEVWNQETQKGVLIKRYGAVYKRGNVLIRSYSSIRKCSEAAEEEENKRFKRGYERSPTTSPLTSLGSSPTTKVVETALLKHYGYGANVDRVLNALSLSAVFDDEVADAEVSLPASVESADWGAW